MRNIDENTITPAVLARLANTPSPRLKEIMSALVNHLHDFAREVKLTEEEWLAGIEYLTATGQKCDDKRQEFILLSDTLGLSMLVVAMNHAKPPGATEATVFGPFHTLDAPTLGHGARLGGGCAGAAAFRRRPGQRPSKAGRSSAPWSTFGRPTTTGSTTFSARNSAITAAPAACCAPMGKVACAFEAWRRWPIRSRPTARWARCFAPPRAIPGGPRMFTSWSRPKGSSLW